MAKPVQLVTVRITTVCLVCGDDVWQGERAYAICGGYECLVCRARQAAPGFMAVADRRIREVFGG